MPLRETSKPCSTTRSGLQHHETCGVSERRACRTIDQPRSSQRYTPRVKDDEPRLVARILELVGEFPRYGYRMITRLLVKDGWSVYFKRIFRLWKREGIRVSTKNRKKRRLGTVAGGITCRQAKHPNHVWSIDFIFDRTTNGFSVKTLPVIDEFTRECVALEANRPLITLVQRTGARQRHRPCPNELTFSAALFSQAPAALQETASETERASPREADGAQKKPVAV